MSDDVRDTNVYQLRQPEDLLATYRQVGHSDADDVIARVNAAFEGRGLARRRGDESRGVSPRVR